MEPTKIIDPNIMEMARLSYSEIDGRLHACEILTEQTMTTDSPEIQFGLTTATQELLLRTAEASLKMLFMLEFNEEPKRDHDLKQIWDRLSPEMKREIEEEYQGISPFPEGANFKIYSMKDFQKAGVKRRGTIKGQIIRSTHG